VNIMTHSLTVPQAGPSRATAEQRAAPAALPKRAIFATVLGNWLEFFDFTVYALFAVAIGKQFFPVSSASGQLLLSLATFGVGFIMRPLGGIVIGAYADRVGRKAALTLTILLMALGTAIIGLTPSYAQIGLAAPCLIVFARLLQGFSAGGELGAATTYLVELAPDGRRGLYASWQYASQGLATLAASLMGFGLAATLSPEAMDSWGWRIPFLFGLLIGPVGLYIRKYMDETAHVAAAPASTSGVLKILVRDHTRLILIGILTILGGTVSSYIIGKYMTTYALHTLRMPVSTAMMASVVSGLVIALGSVLGGWLSDRFGRRVIMILPRALFLLAVYPAFLVITGQKTPESLLLMVGVLSLLQAMSGAVGIVALPECFPRSVRTSGLSITYALGVTLFGGSAQFVATWILDATGDPMSLAWYLIAANAVTTLALFGLRPPAPNQRLD
jgi:MFS family permease